MAIKTSSITQANLITSIRTGQKNLVHELDINDSLYAIKDKAVDALAGTVATITSDIVNLDSRLTKLDGAAIKSLPTVSDTAEAGQYVSAVSQSDGKISVTRANLPSVTDTAVAGQYVSAVSQSNGQITVTRENLPTVKLPTVDEISDTGKAIISVSQTNGAIAATAGDIAASHVTVADTGNKFTGETVEAVLAELEGKIATLTGVDTDTLNKIQQIIKEISTGDGQDPANAEQAWATLIDKLQGLSIDSQEKTVKQYVDYYVDALQTSITGLGGRLTTAEGTITDLGGRLTTAEGNIATINSTIESNERVTAAALTDLNSRLNSTSHTHNTDVTFKDWEISYVTKDGAEKLVFTNTSKTAAGSLKA